MLAWHWYLYDPNQIMKHLMKDLRSKLTLFFALLLTAAFTACDDEGSDMGTTGSARIGVTDAAVDDESITGVYLSVKGVEAISEDDGKDTIVYFEEAMTFDVMAYQNGDVFDLGEGDVNVGIYNELRLILDADNPAYLAFEDGSEEDLEVPSGTSSGYKIKGDFQISANNQTDLIIDIDLRKALVLTGNGRYILRPTARLIESEATGRIEGTVEEADFITDEKLVVYAYAAGTYEESEADEPAEGESRFENSINSAIVQEDGTFTLAFMEDGDYDLIVAAYEPEVEIDFVFGGLIDINVMIEGEIVEESLEISSNQTTEVSLELLPIL